MPPGRGCATTAASAIPHRQDGAADRMRPALGAARRRGRDRRRCCAFWSPSALSTRRCRRALAGPDFARHPPQRVIEVTEAVTIAGETFEFADDYRGLEVLSPRGTVIGRDGGREVRTPYDDCVLIMPSRRLGPAGRPRCASAVTSRDRAGRPPRRPPSAAFRRSSGARRCSCSAPCRARNRCAAGILRPSAQPVLADPVCAVRRRRPPDYPARLAFAIAPPDRAVGRVRPGRARGQRRCDDPPRAAERDRPAARRPSAIRAVAFNGTGARRLYDRHFPRRPNLAYLALPSTSPAHARLDFAAKLAHWRALRDARDAGSA